MSWCTAETPPLSDRSSFKVNHGETFKVYLTLKPYCPPSRGTSAGSCRAMTRHICSAWVQLVWAWAPLWPGHDTICLAETGMAHSDHRSQTNRTRDHPGSTPLKFPKTSSGSGPLSYHGFQLKTLLPWGHCAHHWAAVESSGMTLKIKINK